MAVERSGAGEVCVDDAMDQWLIECGQTLADADRCAERLSRAGRGDEVAALRGRITRLRELLDQARRERTIFRRLDETDPKRMNSDT